MSFLSKSRRMGQLLAASTVTAAVLAGAPAAFAQETVTFSVSNITDFHGHLEENAKAKSPEMGAAKLQSLIKYVNQGQQYAFVSSGDNVGGSAFISAIAEDQPTIDALNAMGMSVSAAGNHEFDKGYTDLTGRIQPKSQFPILAANVLKDGAPLMKASEVVVIDGVKVGFVGSVTTQLTSKVAPSAIAGLEITDPVAATNAEATRLKQSGEADVVIALFHEDAEAYAAGFNKDVDILFGGDSHQKTQGEIARDGAAPLVWAQGYEYGKLLNDADITFNKTAGKLVSAKITQYDYDKMTSFGVTADPAVEAIVADAKGKADAEGTKVVGTLDTALYRGAKPGESSGSNRSVESTANSYIAEANRFALEAATGKKVDLGIMNAGGVRSDLAAGEVTYADALTMQPFGNAIAVGTLTGQDILDLLEQQWLETADKDGRNRLALGFSEGFDYAYNPNAKQGERVLGASLHGEPIDPAKEYTVATSTFLWDGGDGFSALTKVKNLNNIGYMDVQALIDYIKSDGDKVRTGQIDAGVVAPATAKAGETVTVELSSLNYSNAEEPQAKTVTVKLAGAEATADIDNTPAATDVAGSNELGRATVKLNIPATAVNGPTFYTITTDAGTEITVPVTVEGGVNGPVQDNGSAKDSSSKTGSAGANALGSALGTGALAVIAAIAAILGAAGMAVNMLPAPLRAMFEDLKARFMR